MRKKHQNIGKWRASLYPGQNEYLLKICAVLPTRASGGTFSLSEVKPFSSESLGLVYRLENAAQLNVESEGESYFCSRQTIPGACIYKQVVIIGFRENERSSFLVALIDILPALEDA